MSGIKALMYVHSIIGGVAVASIPFAVSDGEAASAAKHTLVAALCIVTSYALAVLPA